MRERAGRVIFIEASPELVKRARAQAVREDRSMASLVRRVLEAYLTEQETKAAS